MRNTSRCAALLLGGLSVFGVELNETPARAAPPPVRMTAILLHDKDGKTLSDVCTGKLDRANTHRVADKIAASTPVLAPSLENADGPIVLVFFDPQDRALSVGDANVDSVQLFRGGETTAIYKSSAKFFEQGYCLPVPDQGVLASLISDQKNDTYRVEVTLKGMPPGNLPPAFFRTLDRLAGTTFEARIVDSPSCSDSNRNQFLDPNYPQSVAGASPLNAPKALGSNQRLIVAFFDAKGHRLHVKDALIDTVRLFRDEGSEPVYSVAATPFEEETCIPIPSDGALTQIIKDRDGALYRIEVTFKNGSSLQQKPKYLRRQNAWQAYGWDPFNWDAVGVWLPIGLVGTNLKSNSDGIQFVAVPIGVALGGKWWPRDNFYLGFSAIGSWTIANTNSDTSANQPSKNVTTATNIGAGVLLDVGGFAYLGGIYVVDLRSSHNNPGPMVAVGLGPATIKAIADGTLRF